MYSKLPACLRCKLLYTTLIISILLTACSLAAPENEPLRQVTSEISCETFQKGAHQADNVEVGVDGELKVILCSNQTTGFQWSESPRMSKVDVLQQVGHQYEAPSDGAVGVAGKEIWTFEPLREGTTTLQFEYSRPWEGGEKGVWTLDLEVHARAN